MLGKKLASANALVPGAPRVAIVRGDEGVGEVAFCCLGCESALGPCPDTWIDQGVCDSLLNKVEGASGSGWRTLQDHNCVGLPRVLIDHKVGRSDRNDDEQSENCDQDIQTEGDPERESHSRLLLICAHRDRYLLYMRKSIVASLMLLLAAAGGWAQEETSMDGLPPVDLWTSVTGDFGNERDPVAYDSIGVGFQYVDGIFDVGFEMWLVNDEKYFPPQPQFMRGRWLDFRDGYVALTGETLSFRAGRISTEDEVDTPYSLFISSVLPPLVTMDARFDNGFFFYNTRWMELTRRSDLYQFDGSVGDEPVGDLEPLERGAIYKSYGIRVGRFEFGLQEATVFIGSTFYPEYFFSPIPVYFIQVVNSEPGTPWDQIANENAMEGLFAQYSFPNLRLVGQLFLDDLNEFGIEWLAIGDWQQPAKFAWSLGAELETEIGRFGFFQAGASKYTYAATYTETGNFNRYPYSYTVYPVAEFDAREYGIRPILLEDTYVGYLFGENNAAFRLEYEPILDFASVASSLEYTISGSKAPTNPWHEADWHANEGTEYLDDPELEHRVELSGTIERSFGPFDLTAGLLLGGVWNELELNEVPGRPEEDRIWKPTGPDRFLWEIQIGGRYNFGIRARE